MNLKAYGKCLLLIKISDMDSEGDRGNITTFSQQSRQEPVTFKRRCGYYGYQYTD